MKNIFATLLALLFIGTLAAQSYSVDWGGEYRRSGGIFSNFFLAGITDDAYHMLLYTRKETTLFSYNWDHRLIGTKQVDFNTGRDEMFLNEFVRTQRGNFAVLRQYDRRAKELRTYLSYFNNQSFEGLLQIAAQPMRQRTANEFLGGNPDPTNTDIFEPLVTSPDRSKAVFTNINVDRERNEPETVSLSVFDAGFNPLWNKTYSLPYNELDAQITRSVISNAGEVYLLVKIRIRGSERRQAAGLPPYRYELFKFTADGEVAQLDIDLPSNTAPQYTGLYVSNVPDEPVVVAGMYTDSDRRSNLKGAFLVEIDEDFEISSTNTSEFSSAFLENLVSNRANKRDQGLDNDFVIRSFVRFNDGKLGFVAEETFITTVIDNTAGTIGTNRTRYIFHTNELVIVIFSPEGELVDMQKIDKEFSSSTPMTTSFATAVVDDQLFIVYNDQKNRRERKAIRGKGGGALFTDLTVIDGEGEIIYQESLFTSDATDRKAFIPRQSDYNNERMVLLARSAKFFQCGLLHFE
ncbi:MAG: hypothetical protein AAFN81_02055 [Bacteroidota bacterium]